MPKKDNTLFIDDREQILSYIQSRSKSMFDYITNSKSNYTLWQKTLTHSDLVSAGKRKGSEGLEKNFLYYLSVEDMKIIEKNKSQKGKCAKQSNIALPERFYSDVNIKRLVRRKGPQKTKHEQILLNDYLDVFVVNDSIEYFTQEYTIKILEKLEKNITWKYSNLVFDMNKNNWLTEISLSEAIHGLGTADDKEFHKLRHSMFLNDSIIFVVEHHHKRKKLFIILEKNPRFFTLLGLSDTVWEKYLQLSINQEKKKLKSIMKLNTSNDEKSRKLQSAWKDKLAKEMMGYTAEEGKVFCPFTNISADFQTCSMLFIASHIKRHSDCNSDMESFNINNGLLLSANADALFDKYMITISENKELIFSFLLEKDYQLQLNLHLQKDIFNLILNDERMKNMAVHRKIFFQKEEERRANNKF